MMFMFFTAMYKRIDKYLYLQKIKQCKATFGKLLHLRLKGNLIIED